MGSCKSASDNAAWKTKASTTTVMAIRRVWPPSSSAWPRRSARRVPRAEGWGCLAENAPSALTTPVQVNQPAPQFAKQEYSIDGGVSPIQRHCPTTNQYRETATMNHRPPVAKERIRTVILEEHFVGRLLESGGALQGRLELPQHGWSRGQKPNGCLGVNELRFLLVGDCRPPLQSLSANRRISQLRYLVGPPLQNPSNLLRSNSPTSPMFVKNFPE